GPRSARVLHGEVSWSSPFMARLNTAGAVCRSSLFLFPFSLFLFPFSFFLFTSVIPPPPQPPPPPAGAALQSAAAAAGSGPAAGRRGRRERCPRLPRRL